MEINQQKHIVISGVNLTEGGILSILEDCLKSFAKLHKTNQLKVTVLVNAKDLVKEYLNIFDVYEYPKVKPSWLRRLYFEYVQSKEISKKLKPDLWISLHDITPNVACSFQVVYCHNPSSFYNLPFKEGWLNIKEVAFNLFYKYLYQINIKKNKFVIVQQGWLRTEFENRYKVKTIVAYPEVKSIKEEERLEKAILGDLTKKFRFFYPSFPRVFKNFEILFEAIAYLSERRDDFELLVTIDGKENRYSKYIAEKFKDIKNVKFLGKINRDEVYRYYKESDCLVFPSKLETWGLPLSEFKAFGKPVIAADLPYAYETLGNYPLVKFFKPLDAKDLMHCLELAINREIEYVEKKIVEPTQPFFSDWDNLLLFLMNELKNE